jgi:hypothetical protein
MRAQNQGHPLKGERLRLSGPEGQRAGAARRFVASVSVKGAGGHGIGRAPPSGDRRRKIEKVG